MADAEKKEMNANDLQREQVERLIETTADLQKQVLRKFANSVIEEMRYHFRVAMQKNELLKEENAELAAKLAEAQSEISEWRMLSAKLLKTIRKLDPQGFSTIDTTIHKTKKKQQT